MAFRYKLQTLTGFARAVDGELVADEIVGDVDADVTGDGVLVEVVLLLDGVRLHRRVVQAGIRHKYTAEEHADPQHINLKSNRTISLGAF